MAMLVYQRVYIYIYIDDSLGIHENTFFFQSFWDIFSVY